MDRSALDYPRWRLLPLLWRQTSLRHWCREPRQALLLVLIVALGVAVFTSVRIANRAAVVGFRQFTEAVSGTSDWIVSSPSGWLPGEVLPELREALGAEPAHLLPVLELVAAEAPEEGRAPRHYNVMGLDLVAIQNLPVVSGRDEAVFVTSEDGGAVDIFDALATDNAVFISRELGRLKQLDAGDTLRVLINDSIVELEVGGFLPEREGEIAPPRSLLVMDLPQLQRLAGREGWISRVEVLAEEGPNRAERRGRIRRLLNSASAKRGAAAGGGAVVRSGSEALALPEESGVPRAVEGGGEEPVARWTVESPDQSRESGAVMTRAFRLNLLVLSLIALLVGLYLVLQALDAAVVKRRQEIATLRSLGVEAGTVRWLWLFEAAVIGLIGSASGVLLGWGLAQFSVKAVSATVNALYQAGDPRSAVLVPGDVWLGLGIGFTASVLAGVGPAQEAARTPPAQILVRGYIDRGLALFRRPLLGLLPIAVGAVLFQLPPLYLEGGTRFPIAGYLCALFWMIGGSMLVPTLLPLFALAVKPFSVSRATLRLAESRWRRPSGRHSLAAAGLFIAVGMAASMAILIHSFEQTMRVWIEQTLRGDIYIASAGSSHGNSDNRISADTWSAIAIDPRVAAADPLQLQKVTLRGLGTFISGVELESPMRSYVWVEPPPEDTVLLRGEHTLEPGYVSESFSERFSLGRGDFVTLETPSGPRRVAIQGIFADYGNERGSISIDRSTFTEWFADPRAYSLTVRLNVGVDPEAVRSVWLEQYPGLKVRTNQELRADILRVFRQTFAITYALQVIGVVVAVVGLGLALVCLIIENRADLTVLRALGMTHREIARSVAAEGLGVALSGIIGGLVLSFFLGVLLVFVINKQSFGWTLFFDLPLMQMALLAGVIAVIGWFVSYRVGLWGAQLPADREE